MQIKGPTANLSHMCTPTRTLESVADEAGGDFFEVTVIRDRRETTGSCSEVKKGMCKVIIAQPRSTSSFHWLTLSTDSPFLAALKNGILAWDIRGKYSRYFGYLRHQTQLASRSDAFPFLDVVNGNGSFAACSIFRFVPIWVLNWGICSSIFPNCCRWNISKKKNPPQSRSVTFVTTIIVNTSPFLKGRSCSDVPLKLYLATHSVPCGHGAFGKTDRTPISRNIFKALLIRHVLTCDLWALHERLHSAGVSQTWTSVMAARFSPLTGAVL